MNNICSKTKKLHFRLSDPHFKTNFRTENQKNWLKTDREKDLVLLQKLTTLGHVKRRHKPFLMWFFLSSVNAWGVAWPGLHSAPLPKAFLQFERFWTKVIRHIYIGFRWDFITMADPFFKFSPGNPLLYNNSEKWNDPVRCPVAIWIRCLIQVFPDPGNDNNPLIGPGGSNGLNSFPQHHPVSIIAIPFERAICRQNIQHNICNMYT